MLFLTGPLTMLPLILSWNFLETWPCDGKVCCNFCIWLRQLCIVGLTISKTYPLYIHLPLTSFSSLIYPYFQACIAAYFQIQWLPKQTCFEAIMFFLSINLNSKVWLDVSWIQQDSFHWSSQELHQVMLEVALMQWRSMMTGSQAMRLSQLIKIEA